MSLVTHARLPDSDRPDSCQDLSFRQRSVANDKLSLILINDVDSRVHVIRHFLFNGCLQHLLMLPLEGNQSMRHMP